MDIVFASFHVQTIAAAPQLGFWHGAGQAWIDIFVSAVKGIATLPLALILVWLIHRMKLDRWAILSAVIATVGAVVAASILELLGFNIWAAAVLALKAIGIHPFVYELWPALAILLIGSFFFALWLKRTSSKSDFGIFE